MSTIRRPKTLHEAGAPLWKSTCQHLVDIGHPPTSAQLPLIETYVRSTLRLETWRAAEADLDPSDKEAREVLKLIRTEESRQLAAAVALKITPAAAAAQHAGPKGGRAPGTGTNKLRKAPAAASSGGDVHWLDRARAGEGR